MQKDCKNTTITDIFTYHNQSQKTPRKHKRSHGVSNQLQNNLNI